MISLDKPKKMELRLLCSEQYEESLEKYKAIVNIIVETLNKHNCEFLDVIINHLNVLYAEFLEYNKGELAQYYMKPKSLSYKRIWIDYCKDCIVESLPEYEEDEEQ